MTIEEYYEDLDNSAECVNMHKRVKNVMTLDDLVSIAVCLILYTDNHYAVEKKINLCISRW